MQAKIYQIELWLDALEEEYQKMKQRREDANTFEEFYVTRKEWKQEYQMRYFISTLRQFLKDVKEFCFLNELDASNDLECIKANAFLDEKVYQFHKIINQEIYLYLKMILDLKEEKNFLKIYQKKAFYELSFIHLLEKYLVEYIPKEYYDSLQKINRFCLEEKYTYKEYEKKVEELKKQKNTLPYGCILERKQKIKMEH